MNRLTYVIRFGDKTPIVKPVSKILGDVTENIGMKKTDEIYRSMMFVFLMNIFNTIIGLPFSIYGTFVLEERHGFNQQTPLFYVKDQFKKFIISQIITMPLIAAVIKIVYWGGEFFFIYLWAFVVGFTLFMMVLYPEFIAPLFDKVSLILKIHFKKKTEKENNFF